MIGAHLRPMIGSARMPLRWTLTARALHWGMALGILAIVPAGYLMAWTYLDGLRGGPRATTHVLASQVHHTLGLLILGLALIRLAWRSGHPAPPLPKSVPPAAAFAARGVQALLYVLLLALPITGWAALSALGSGAGFPAPQMWFFGHDGFGPNGVIPHLVEPRPWDATGPISYRTFARAHRYLLWLGAVLVLLHVCGALWHQFVRCDGLLRRMWRGY